MDLELWKKQKKELGITFDDLSQKTHISISTLKDIFRGKTYAPRIDTVQAIEKALGLSNDLWTDEDYKSGVSMTKKAATVSILENNERFITFTQKEIMQMSKTFRKVFRLQGCTAHVRKRQDDRYNCSYEIRYTRDGYNISASGTTLAAAKQKFIDKVNNAAAPTNALHRVRHSRYRYRLVYGQLYRKT